MRNGQRICVDELILDDEKKKHILSKRDDDHMVCKSGNKIICFFKIEKNFVKPTRVLNL